MKETWSHQEWAMDKTKQIQKEFEAALQDRMMKTMAISAAFSLLGGLVMTCVGIAVTRPLKRISIDMLHIAKLEFLAGQADDDNLQQRSFTRRFFSLQHLTRKLSYLTSRSRSRSKTRLSSRRSEDSMGLTRTIPRGPSASSSSTDTEEVEVPHDRDARHSHHAHPGPESDECEEKEEHDLETGEELSSSRCSQWSTPKEVIEMRQSFTYMVTGLKSFARYLDPDIMRMVVGSKRQAQLGMGRAEVTIFFSDIANFTTIAESLEPEIFMAMLTEYLDEMSKLIMGKQGVVGEFIGDAIMAWWNVPIDLGPEHTAMALEAALAQQNRLAELRDTWHDKGLPDVRVRMGLVKGNVLAGNIGSCQRMKYGLVGDSVNLASRLEGLCKYYGVSIIIEQDAAFAPGVQNRFDLRLLDLVIVKGRTQPTELYELVCEKGTLPDSCDSEDDLTYFLNAYAEIHRLYRAKSFDACLVALQCYCGHFPHDAPSKMLLRRVETLLNEGLPAEWTAVHRLLEK